MADYKPSPLATGVTKGRDPKARPRTTDIDLQGPPMQIGPERPIGEYDPGRAKRQMSRPIFSRKVSR